MKCPICGKRVFPDAPGAVPPFCSQRCKNIDVKRWLGEEYAIETVNEDELEREIAELPGDAAEN